MGNPFNPFHEDLNRTLADIAEGLNYMSRLPETEELTGILMRTAARLIRAQDEIIAQQEADLAVLRRTLGLAGEELNSAEWS